MEIKKFIVEHLNLIIYIGTVLLVALILTRITRFIIGRYIRRSPDNLRSELTNFRFLRNSITAVIYLVALILIVYSLPGGEAIAVSLFASAGIIAAIVGFASQAAFSNIVSGIFIVIFKPFRVGDIIQVGTGMTGTVEDITLRHVVIRDFENKRIIMPNSIISDQTVTNFSIDDERIRRHVEFQISYESDVQLAKRIMQEEAEAHPFCIDVREEGDPEDRPKVVVRMIRLEDSGFRLRAYVWSTDPETSFVAFTELNESISARFAAEGIEIPYPHRTLVYKKDILPQQVGE